MMKKLRKSHRSKTRYRNRCIRLKSNKWSMGVNICMRRRNTIVTKKTTMIIVSIRINKSIIIIIIIIRREKITIKTEKIIITTRMITVIAIKIILREMANKIMRVLTVIMEVIIIKVIPTIITKAIIIMERDIIKNRMNNNPRCTTVNTARITKSNMISMISIIKATKSKTTIKILKTIESTIIVMKRRNIQQAKTFILKQRPFLILLEGQSS